MSKPRSQHRVRPPVKPSQRRVVLSVAWYTEPEWSRVKAAAVDPERFEATFAEWVVMAEGAIQKMRAAGIHPHKFFVKAEELLAWCMLHNKQNDAATRAEFVSQRRRAQDEAGA